MGKVKLLPSEIRFSQDSINNTFSQNANLIGGMKIGEVLDRIYYDPTSSLLDAVKPNMQVSQHPRYAGLWFAVNNRSLWVLKQLEILGRLTEPMRLLKVDRQKLKDRFSTKSRGQLVMVRGTTAGGERAIEADFWMCDKRRAEEYSGAIQIDGFTGLYIDEEDYDSDEFYS